MFFSQKVIGLIYIHIGPTIPDVSINSFGKSSVGEATTISHTPLGLCLIFTHLELRYLPPSLDPRIDYDTLVGDVASSTPSGTALSAWGLIQE